MTSKNYAFTSSKNVCNGQRWQRHREDDGKTRPRWRLWSFRLHATRWHIVREGVNTKLTRIRITGVGSLTWGNLDKKWLLPSPSPPPPKFILPAHCWTNLFLCSSFLCWCQNQNFQVSQVNGAPVVFPGNSRDFWHQLRTAEVSYPVAWATSGLSSVSQPLWDNLIMEVSILKDQATISCSGVTQLLLLLHRK